MHGKPFALNYRGIGTYETISQTDIQSVVVVYVVLTSVYQDAIVGALLVAEKTTGIPVGAVIALLVEDKKDVAALKNLSFADFNTAAASAAPPPPAPVEKPKPTAAPAAPSAKPNNVSF
jgi:hypothetical protein